MFLVNATYLEKVASSKQTIIVENMAFSLYRKGYDMNMVYELLPSDLHYRF